MTFDFVTKSVVVLVVGNMNYDIVIVSDSIAIIFSYVLMISIIIYHAVFLIF